MLLLPGLDGTELLFGPLLIALPSWIRPRVVTYPTRGANGYADLLPLVEASVEASSDVFTSARAAAEVIAEFARATPASGQ